MEKNLSDIPKSVSFILEEPLICGGIPVFSIGINNYAGYKGYAPEGCSAITSIIMGDSYAYWKKCKENGTYEDEKHKLADSFIKNLVKKYPIIEGKIAVWDVATPLTYERYLGSYKGSWMTVMGKDSKMQSYPSKPESIKNVYFCRSTFNITGWTSYSSRNRTKSSAILMQRYQYGFSGEYLMRFC